MSGAFQGFCPETVDFLWGIRFNNNRDWFQAHKEVYLQHLYRPMQALAQDIFLPFENKPGYLCKVSRIYRDARFKHATPYKESLWICIREGAAWWGEEPSLFFELTPDCYSYGFLLWGPKADWMQRFRAEIIQHPQIFLNLAQQVERDTGLAITGDQYKRKKICENPALEPWWNLKNILAIQENSVDEALFSADLAVQVRKTLERLIPLHEFCKKIQSSGSFCV